MPSDLDQAFKIENLRRAWLWTKTNRNATFKNYFRNVYSAYSLAVEENLSDLHDRLVKRLFQPSRPTKLYFPKKSGILRPYSLLHMEDQILYQALVNIIAQRLLPHIRSRYYISVFGNLYAGKRSLFFYRDWKKAYRAFSKAVRSSYEKGYQYAASFDLTACYDSIDHGVLKHFLRDIELEQEFYEYLCNCLKGWMASSSRPPIYQEHGIPQGPLGSGLLSECVLRYFDSNNPKSSRVRYFRYVDDIRLMAKTETKLREKLVELDMHSKDIGLFPQSSKIDVHRITNIDNEVKSISQPPEIISRTPAPDQEKVRKRLKELSKGYKVNNETRFKYVLARTVPNAAVQKRLLVVVRRQPHLYFPIFNYLSKSRKLTKVVSKKCVKLLGEQYLYPAFTAALLRALQGRFNESIRRRLFNYCRKKIRTRDPEVCAVSGAILLENGSLNYAQIKRLSQSHEWWVRSAIIKHIRGDLLGEPSYEAILNKLIRDSVADVAIVAAELLIAKNLSVHTPRRNVHKLAQFALKASGVIGRISSTQCYISEAMIEVLGPRLESIDWRTITGNSYKSVLRKIARWKGYSQTDATAFVSITDTINDTLVDLLFKHDGAIGNYSLGNLGAALSPNSRFAKKYPKLFTAVNEVHSRRLESDLSHFVNRRTGKFTGVIRFKNLRRIKQLLLSGYLEMWRKW